MYQVATIPLKIALSTINSDSYDNYDLRKDGGMADGFASKQNHSNGNEFHGCRAWNNSDDGFDFYNRDGSEYPNKTAPKVIVTYSWSFENGFDTWGYGLDGNGSGFKMGGSSARDTIARHTIKNSVAFGNAKKGFDQNNNRGGMIVENNVAVSNGINFAFGGNLSSGRHSFKNNVSVNGKTAALPITIGMLTAQFFKIPIKAWPRQSAIQTALYETTGFTKLSNF